MRQPNTNSFAYGNANIHSDGNSDGNGYIHADGDSNSYVYTDGNSDEYSWLADADVSARQPIHGSGDRGQYCSGHHRHRQSRG
jgi:hypothetical protein